MAPHSSVTTFDWEPVKEGFWATTRGDTIHKVSPRGSLTLYAVRLVGSRRPEWLDTLAHAKRYRAAVE